MGNVVSGFRGAPSRHNDSNASTGWRYPKFGLPPGETYFNDSILILSAVSNS